MYRLRLLKLQANVVALKRLQTETPVNKNTGQAAVKDTGRAAVEKTGQGPLPNSTLYSGDFIQNLQR